MPAPVSKRQFRFVQAVAHGNSKNSHGLTRAQAMKGIAEMRASKKSYASLPQRATQARRAARRRRAK
jgi:hypothetical protein